MRSVIIPTFVLAAVLAGPALAQSSTSPAQPHNQATNPSSNMQQSGDRLVTVQKLTQDLQKAGFTDVSVVAESFVVQAKSKDGDPVLMTIGPHGFTMLEANTVKPSTTGSTNSSSSAQPNTQKK